MPPLLWPESFEGATCCRCVAKDWRQREEGENCMVDGATVEDRVTGMIDQLLASGVWLGAQGAIAT